MRRGHFDKKWVEDAGKLIGVSFGSDYCAEHEWGMGDLRTSFGMQKSVTEKNLLGLKTVETQLYGIDVRTIHKNPAVYFQEGPLHMIGYTGGNRDFLKTLFKSEKTFIENTDFVGLWDNRSFALISTNEERMRDLWAAFERNDIAMFTGQSDVFDNGAGLNICIVSRIPAPVLADMQSGDMDAHKMRDTATATGIEDRLKAANKKFFSLSPRWTDEKRHVRFWLNPMEHMYNSGWFTVEDLDRWIKDEGPVMKREEVEDDD